MSNMEAKFEANSPNFEDLIIHEDDEEGCEAEVMALVVIDDFPIEAVPLHATLSRNLPD
jgi:hypothetical protein